MSTFQPAHHSPADVAGPVNPETLHVALTRLDKHLAYDEAFLALPDHVLLSAPWGQAGYRYVGHDQVLVMYRARTRTYLLLPDACVRRARASDLDPVRAVWAQAIEGTFAQVLAWVCDAWPRYRTFVGQPLLDHQATALDPSAFDVDPRVAQVVRAMVLASGRVAVLEGEDLTDLVCSTLHVRRGSAAARRIERRAQQTAHAWVAARPDECWFAENVEATSLRYVQTVLTWLCDEYPDLVRDLDDPIDALRVDVAH